LLGTVVGTVCLAELAALRNQLRFRDQVWGNLATEEGVDELLRVGWKVEGSHLEVYDKPRRIGYDESMLMGGFEEQQQRVGVEITVTHEESSESVLEKSTPIPPQKTAAVAIASPDNV